MIPAPEIGNTKFCLQAVICLLKHCMIILIGCSGLAAFGDTSSVKENSTEVLEIWQKNKNNCCDFISLLYLKPLLAYSTTYL